MYCVQFMTVRLNKRKWGKRDAKLNENRPNTFFSF